MFANLLVLPALVLTTEKWSGKSDLIEEPALKIFRSQIEMEEEDEENNIEKL
jgi:hypothetical protein